MRPSWARGAVSMLTLAGCPGPNEPETSDAPNESGAGDDVEGSQPFRDAWRVVHEGNFAAFDDAGDPRVFALTIGTPDTRGDNFISRGDVIVAFTGVPGRIKIEFRKFTYSRDEGAANAVYERISLWAYNAAIGAPLRPDKMDPGADCTADDVAWRDDCAIYLYYDGFYQIGRAGADIRVTLPPEYRQRLDVVTSDNVVEDTYPNRGSVCIDNLAASASITMESGVAIVKMSDDVMPAPGCSPQNIADCVDVDDPTTTAAMEGVWSRNCACAGMSMGSLSVTAGAPYAADVIVDSPSALWASITAENQAGGGSSDECPVSLQGYGGEFVPDPAQYDPDKPWRLIGDANRPSDAALAGGGFALKLTSAGCGPVATVESPLDWDPEIDDPEPVTRGFIELCTDCLPDDPCAELPGA